jgi:hypothetical protein
MDLEPRLRQLFERHESDLGVYAWMYETDRWAELIFCLLSRYQPQNDEATRMAVSSLQYLGLLAPATLAGLDQEADLAPVITYVLKRHGFSDDDLPRLRTVLAHAGQAMRGDGGKVQRFLRRHGEVIRDELASAVTCDAMSPDDARYAVTQWLQNALSLPVSLEHEAVKEFCAANDATSADLLDAIDALDLNVALVDDLLELDRAQATAPMDETATVSP